MKKQVNGLTARQRIFVACYIGACRYNATEAARRAGYRWPQIAGPRLTTDRRVRALLDAHHDRLVMKSTEVLARLSAIASGDLADFLAFDDDGGIRLDLAKAMRADKLGLVKKLKGDAQSFEIELHDSVRALLMLAKYHGLFKRGALPVPSRTSTLLDWLVEAGAW